MVALKRPRLRVRSLESRILGARPSESMSPGVALLNGDIITGVDRFPPANTGTQEITVNFPEPMRGAPKVFAMWEDTTITLTYVDKLVITGATSSGFKIATNRLKPSENWWFCYIAIYNR